MAKKGLKMVEFHDCASTDTKYKKGMSKKFATKLATCPGGEGGVAKALVVKAY